MSWYIAKIVFQIMCGDGNHQAQFDEQLRLIQATNLAEALMKARAIGEKGQDRFLNQAAEWVQWQFIGVPELCPIGDPQDGAEVYYQITEPDNADAYIEKINRQTFTLQTQ